ncbi:hypothetical protein [Oceanobacillus sp. CAU 1775]
MTEEKINQLIYLALVLAAIGLIFIFFSYGFGRTIADSWFATSDYALFDYEAKANAYTNNFLVSGGILFGVGLTTTVFAYYKKLSISE